MKILFYEQSPRVEKELIRLFIQNAFEIKSIDNKHKLPVNVKSEKYDLLLVDYNPEDKEVVKYIMDIKTDSGLKGIRIFLHSRTTERKFLIPMVKLGINGIILKPFDPGKFMRHFLELCKKNNFDIERREHIRIVPKKEHKAKVMVQSPEMKRIMTGDVVNISYGGLALRSFGRDLVDNLKERDVLQDITITINERKIKSDAVVMRIIDRVIGISLVGMTIDSENELCRYIYENIALGDEDQTISADEAGEKSEGGKKEKKDTGITLDRHGFPKKNK